MKSIQTKFIILILGCVLLCDFVIGGAGVINAQKVVDTDSAEIMNLNCSEMANKLDEQFARIEQSVETFALYATQQIESVERLKKDRAYLNEYTHKLETLADNIANNTAGAVSVYARFNPEYWPSTSGLFLNKTSPRGNFQSLTPTDFSHYSPDDVEHVGWYYIPIENGKATWMEPYLNKNIYIYMISYVIPIYLDDTVIGVVGMDIDFDVVRELVSNLSVYDSGYAFLIDREAKIMYHQNIEIGESMAKFDATLKPVVSELEKNSSGDELFTYKWQGTTKKMAFRSLSNGMRLALTAPETEIDAARNGLVLQITIAAFCIALFAVVLTVILTRRMVRPLKELNNAAMKIADGDLSISLSCQTNDEVGTLAKSFQVTVAHLQKYVDYINGLAYRDAMTGVKNKTAYQEAVKNLEEQLRIGNPEFALIVFDINDLKYVNDTYGHDFGDMLIIEGCKIICQVFKKSPIYRIGGDEFVIILENSDFDNYQELIKEFDEEIIKCNDNSNKEYQISIARGIAIYNRMTDLIVADVFKRADNAMYQNKANMKNKKLD